MPEKSTAKKLFIKGDHTVLLINAPKNYQALFGELPPGAKLVTKASAPVDAIYFFAGSRNDLEMHLSQLKRKLKPDGLLWIMYHKGTSKVKTDINRDTLHVYARSSGWDGVMLISIDEDWSAMRFKSI